MTLSIRSADRILELYETAKENGSLISLQEILLLLPEQASEAELEKVVSAHPSLNSKLELRSGYVIGKDSGRTPNEALSTEARSREKARLNLSLAGQFARMLNGQKVRLIAVSGSTSYNSTSKSTDVDFFCVTKSGFLWTQLARLLILARAFRTSHPSMPELCLSCFMDEKYAERAFAEDRSPLFARDSLQAIVIRGEPYLKDLLARGNWISELYPLLYARRMEGWSAIGPSAHKTKGIVKILNEFCYLTVGSYIRLKCFLRNKWLIKMGRESEAFDALISGDHFILESRRYKQMRKLHAK